MTAQSLYELRLPMAVTFVAGVVSMAGLLRSLRVRAALWSLCYCGYIVFYILVVNFMCVILTAGDVQSAGSGAFNSLAFTRFQTIASAIVLICGIGVLAVGPIRSDSPTHSRLAIRQIGVGVVVAAIGGFGCAYLLPLIAG